MKLDKKSLIQIVILIVLVIGGAGAYLVQQDGGLDFVSGLFESEPATIRAPTPAAAGKPAPGPARRLPSNRLHPRFPRRPPGDRCTGNRLWSRTAISRTACSPCDWART